LDNSKFQIALGQSGHVLSPHYDDLQKSWKRLQGFRILRNPQPSETLTLLP